MHEPGRLSPNARNIAEWLAFSGNESGELNLTELARLGDEAVPALLYAFILGREQRRVGSFISGVGFGIAAAGIAAGCSHGRWYIAVPVGIAVGVAYARGAPLNRSERRLARALEGANDKRLIGVMIELTAHHVGEARAALLRLLPT